MDYFVNLPLSWVANDPAWLDWFIGEGICPELGLDEGALGQDRSWHEAMNRKLRDAGLACSVHLPFMGLVPADSEPAERARAGALLRKAADLTALYGARHMIGHPGYKAERHGVDAAGHTPREEWLEHSRAVWLDLPERAGAPLYLENIYDPAPSVLATLMRALGAPERGAKGSCPRSAPGIGICFDAGHWHCFSGGRKNRDMAQWLDAYAPYLGHLHVHDNSGESDEHAGVGTGAVPYAAFARYLGERGLEPTVTHEPHTMEAFMETAAWFARHPDMAGLFRWTKPAWTGKNPPAMQ